MAIATSREHGPVRRRRARAASGVALVVAVGTATGPLSPAITFAALTLGGPDGDRIRFTACESVIAAAPATPARALRIGHAALTFFGSSSGP